LVGNPFRKAGEVWVLWGLEGKGKVCGALQSFRDLQKGFRRENSVFFGLREDGAEIVDGA
jgi:hypothetical protein